MRKTRVLIVEDTEDVLEVLGTAVKFSGYDVIAVGTCAEAYSTMIAKAPDLLVADVVLPDGDGVALADAAQQVGIPAILITGDAELAKALSGIGRKCIIKPFSPDVFVRAIEMRLAHQDDQ